MVDASVMNTTDLFEIAEQVARQLSYAGRDSQSVFIVTPVLYASGTSVVCRIVDRGGHFEVTDNGEAAFIADTMGLGGSFAPAASFVSARGGASYEKRAFFVDKVRREQLAGAVAMVANASAQAIERLIFSTEGARIKRSRIVFEQRIRSAFGKDAALNGEVRGATSIWKFDAVVRKEGAIQTVFEFVAPQFSAVASSYMKLTNLQALSDSPKAVVVLADYNNTPPELRATLSLATDTIIGADEAVEAYRQAA
jgi:hypothetical protein